MRKNLYMFRHSNRLSQAAMSVKIGCNRTTYAAIEIGQRNGRETFWHNLQKAFGMSDADLAALRVVDKD